MARDCVSISMRCSPCCGWLSDGVARRITGRPIRATVLACRKLMPWLEVSSALWLAAPPRVRVASAFGWEASLTSNRPSLMPPSRPLASTSRPTPNKSASVSVNR
jgi:hypothetical protein